MKNFETQLNQEKNDELKSTSNPMKKSLNLNSFTIIEYRADRENRSLYWV